VCRSEQGTPWTCLIRSKHAGTATFAAIFEPSVSSQTGWNFDARLARAVEKHQIASVTLGARTMIPRAALLKLAQQKVPR
jgi:hypothetical protein